MGQRRLTALAIATLTVLVVAPAAGAAETTTPSPGSASSAPATSSPQATTVPAEEIGGQPTATAQPVRQPSFDAATSTPDDAKTTPTRKAWRNRDGSASMDITSEPVRYKTSSGWADYDFALVPSGTSSLKARSSDVGVSLPNRSSGNATLATTAGTITLTHPGAADVAAENASDTARYPGALQGRDLVHQLTMFGLKESVVVPTPATGGTYRDTFTLPTGMTARSGGIGVEFVDKTGKAVAAIGGGDAWDASSTTPGASAHTPVTTTLVGFKGSIATVSIATSNAWLTDPARVMPVTIDPPMPIYQNSSINGSDDMSIYQTLTSPSAYRPYELFVGNGGANGIFRTAVQFPGSAIPLANRGQVVVSGAYFRAYNYYSPATPRASRPIALYGITTSWIHQTVSWGSQPSIGAPEDAPWFVSGDGSCCNGTWISWNIKDLAQRWMSGTQDFNGIELRVDTRSYPENDPAAVRGFHGGLTGSNTAPVLHIDYDYKPGTPDQLSPANNAAPHATPTLSARYNQGYGTWGNVLFSVFDQSAPGNQTGVCPTHTCVPVTGASGWGNNSQAVAPGTAVSWTPPTLQDGSYLYTATSQSSSLLWSSLAATSSFMVDGSAYASCVKEQPSPPPSTMPAAPSHPEGDGSSLDWVAHPENDLPTLLNFDSWVPQLESTLGSRYGDIWLNDVGASNVACVAVVNGSAADLATVRSLTTGPLWRVGTVPVTYGSTQLTTYRDSVIQDIQQHQAQAFTSGVATVEDAANKVVVTLNASDVAFSARVALLVPADAIIVRTDPGIVVAGASTSSQYAYTEHQGGLAIDGFSAPNVKYQNCSVGFTANDNATGAVVGLTAAHCFANVTGTQPVAVPSFNQQANGPAPLWDPVGQFVRNGGYYSTPNNGTDVAVYSIDDASKATNHIYKGANVSRNVTSLYARARMKKGVSICLAARHTRDCQKIRDSKARPFTSYDPSEPGWHTLPETLAWDHPVIGGDSGGALYFRQGSADARAVGILADGYWKSYDDAIGGQPSLYALFTPIQAAESAVGARVKLTP